MFICRRTYFNPSVKFDLDEVSSRRSAEPRNAVYPIFNGSRRHLQLVDIIAFPFGRRKFKNGKIHLFKRAYDAHAHTHTQLPYQLLYVISVRREEVPEISRRSQFCFPVELVHKTFTVYLTTRDRVIPCPLGRVVDCTAGTDMRGSCYMTHDCI